MIELAGSLAQSGNLDDLGETYSIDLAHVRNEFLDKVTPQSVSSVSGIPLARTERGMKSLRQESAGQPTPEASDGSTEQVILDLSLIHI